MDDNSKDPLDKLFVDRSNEVDTHMLAEAISSFVQLYGDVGEIIPLSSWEDLTVQNKLLVFLLARKVLEIKEKIDHEKITPKEIEEQTGLKGNSIRPTLGRLLDERLVRRVEDEEGIHYFVPNYAIPRIHAILTKSK